METTGEVCIQRPDPPVVGKVNHHSIELYWDINNVYQRIGPANKWFRFSIEEEDVRTHMYGTIYSFSDSSHKYHIQQITNDRRMEDELAFYDGYSMKHVVQGLESSTSYRFRLKVTGHNGEYAYSPLVTVSTTREPMTGEHLHRAVNMNDEDAVLKILQSGHVKVDIPDKLGFSPLMIAAQRGYFSVNIQPGTVIDVLWDPNSRVLHVQIVNNGIYLRIVQLLIDHGADINKENGSGKNSLILACFAGHLEVVEYLRKQGASWESRDKGGCTAMHSAVDGGNVKLIEWMISDGCEVDSRDSGSKWTPLMRVSAVTGNTHVARRLIAAGADVNVKDKDGKTPLMVAALNNHERLVRLLIEKGADCSITNEYGIGISEMAKAFNRQNMVVILEDMKKEIL